MQEKNVLAACHLFFLFSFSFFFSFFCRQVKNGTGRKERFARRRTSEAARVAATIVCATVVGGFEAVAEAAAVP